MYRDVTGLAEACLFATSILRQYCTAYRRGALKSLLVLLFAIPFGSLCAQETITEYRNPLDVSIADPHVLKENGVYYLYGTSHDQDGFSVHSSTDMIHWRRHGKCWDHSSASWGQRDFWAPEVIKVDDTYYMYYTARNEISGNLNVCVATSNSPLGPFQDHPTPIMPTYYSYLDGNPYYDEASGKHYMFAVREDLYPSTIEIVQLADPPLDRVGSPQIVLTASQDWENDWVEAPFVLRHNNAYYMMYSGWAFWESEYAVGYATSDSLFGPWVKSDKNPIIAFNTKVSGPGHNSVIESPDGTELFAIYHTHLTFAGGGPRQLAIDRLEFKPQGSGIPDHLKLVEGRTTVGYQPFPSGAQPRLRGKSDGFDLPVLDRERWNIFGEEPANWSLDNGQLLIDTQESDIAGDRINGRNIFLQYAPEGDFSFDTRLNFNPTANFEQAFLILWDDQSNFIRFGPVYAGGPKIETGVEIDGIYSGTHVPNTWGSNIRLKIERQGDYFSLYAGNVIGNDWTQIGQPVYMFARQPQVGVGALAPISGAEKTASFNYFNITSTSDVADWQIY